MTPRDLILPSFFADALALGPHWIYDAEEIRSLYPSGLSNYDKPHSSYHQGKSAGDFTHYGDQALVLLRSVTTRGWSIDSWRADWKEWAEKTNAYMDGACRRTLENLRAGLNEPSDSSDLAGAARLSPLFATLDGRELIEAARAQTALTHGDPQVIDTAEFIARATISIRGGASLDESFDEAASHPYDGLPAITWLAEAREASEGDLARNAARIGLACNVRQAFPLALAVALKHEADPVAALAANALLGGDSAARGMPLGLLLGARHGLQAFPEVWTSGLSGGAEIISLLKM
ncbi:ADP-ribosylglycohydrolase family protein [Haloferula sp.]|uniref:ADP-ribosylglycohydrolase family protein n=1 Tax=Haloferula sp. TaxID=2497595 RepID=UPI003C7262F8